MIKGILFDMDGVLIDSEPVILQAALAYLSDIGITAQPEDFIPFIGTGDKRYLCGVGEKYGVSIDFEQAKKALFSYYQRFANNRGPMPGVLRFIANARKAGLKLALATSAQRMKAAINLEAIGLKFEDFDMVVTGDVVKRTKPNPDIYQLSGLSLGLSTDECLVVEDALNGVQAGKAAGCSVCALESTFTITELSDAGADYVLSSLDAFADFSSINDFNALLASDGG
ncbi:MAG: HAD-IA family hydrolase, partial [Sphaerochaeta sp.]|nr:HAD-IA family hydrolase [Sphaerochaeta sp.]